MYESIGRRGGVARAPPVEPTPNPKTCSPGKNTKDIRPAEGPYWTSIQQPEHDSDHDSAIYAELDKQSSKAASSNAGTPQTLPKTITASNKRPAPPPPPMQPQRKQEVQQDAGEEHKGAISPPASFSLELEPEGSESEAVYTHV